MLMFLYSISMFVQLKEYIDDTEDLINIKLVREQQFLITSFTSSNISSLMFNLLLLL